MKPPPTSKPTPKLEEYFQNKGIPRSAPAEDGEAKKLASAWKVKELAKPVVLLSFGQVGTEAQFLQALAKAIDERLVGATVIDALQIEREKNWKYFLQASTLKWILSPPLPLGQFPDCALHYKHNPTSGAHTLGERPMILLSPISAYLQNPALKAELWKQLCSSLK